MATSRKRWPPIPRVVQGLAGSVRVVVRRSESFKSGDGDTVWGLYKPAERRILIAGKLPPALRWHTLIHEWAHCWLLDAGLPNLIHGDEAERNRNLEVFCDTLATVAVRSMASHLGLDPWDGSKR
jgi:Zn-dependent peptidase ImmA (M78 family)